MIDCNVNKKIFITASLASSFLALCSVVGKKHTSDIILPIFLQLLKDEDSDVRINLFKKLNEITKVCLNYNIFY